ncbi:hypothetical protein CEQ90_19565 [Lewinellaceae bacterium SD302]|nr:hypothetical protein CEQ90_19565 [Lewinellaceae bacterium SD302]
MKVLNYIFLTFSILFCCNSTFGQEVSTKDVSRISIHLTSRNVFSENTQKIELISSSESTTTYKINSRLDLGFSYHKIYNQNYYYRIGLNSLNIAESIDYSIASDQIFIDELLEGNEISYSNFGTQFEYGRYFKYGDFSVGSGVYIQPSYQRFKYEPLTSLFFPFSANILFIDIGVNPIMEFKIKNSISLLIQLPLNIGGVRYTATNSENPFLTADEQKTNEVNSEFDLRLGAQVGFVFQL